MEEGRKRPSSMRYPQFIFSATVSSAESTALPIRCMALPTAVFLVFGKLHLILGRDQLRYLQIIGAFHGNRNVRNLFIDGILCIRQRLVGIDDLPVALIRHEVVVSVLCDKSAKALAISSSRNSAHKSMRPLELGVPVRPMMRLILGLTFSNALKRFDW